MQRTRKLSHQARLAIAFVAAAMTLAACGGSPTTSAGAGSGNNGAQQAYKRLNGAAAEKQRSMAVKLAKEEGQLTWYTSMKAEVADAVKKKFQEKFGIDVHLYRADSETILHRLLQESSAGRLGADVVETNFAEMILLSDQGLLGNYAGAAEQRVDDKAQFDSWTATRYNIFLPVWNTNLIQPGEEPQSWADLADSRFRGRLALEKGDYDWYAALTKYWRKQGKSQQQINKLWDEIASNAKTVKGHSSTVELVSAGSLAVYADSYSYHAEQAKKEGAPVAIRSADGKAHAVGFPRPNGVGLLKGAQHPAAAWLFYDWLLSDGQKVLVDEQLTPTTDVPGDHSTDGLTLVDFPVEDLVKNSNKWSAAYDELLRG